MLYLDSEFGKLAYEKYGNGQSVHLLFHGFGQSMKAMRPFLPLKSDEDTFLLFDIFFHGNSKWYQAHTQLDKSKWKSMMKSLMNAEQFSSFHLIGYSMGGKFSLITFELFPKQVNSMVLLAPDGIKTGFWYNLATYPGIFNRIFRYLVFHPQPFFKWVAVLHQLGLMENSLEKFVRQQMATRTMRAQIYFTWNTFKPMQPDLQQIISDWNRLEIPGKLFLGAYDKMVTKAQLSFFFDKIKPLEMIELPCGHNDLITETVRYLQKNP